MISREMARAVGKWACLSHKRTTIIICSLNIVAALFVLHSLYSSLYIFPSNSFSNVVYTEDQIRKMEESIRIRKAAEPVELIRLVEKLKKQLSRENSAVILSRETKRKLAEEILLKLKELNGNGNVTVQREALEIWRNRKLEETRLLELGKATSNSTISMEEANILKGALESSWDVLLEEIGVWMPAEIIHNEHDDRPEGEEEFDDRIVAGPPLPPECNAELHADYAGTAVRWGLTHHKESAADCCQACLDQAKNAKPGEQKCNIWVYCPSETGCYSPDIYEHKHQECWLKQADTPKLNFKDKYSDSYRNAHPTAPRLVPWISGVISI
ncbi:hypothetical protein Sjap_022393 [Stephania japonica]|uniref:Uncharacterized protein n=1 Tax=Stephania japonica TaxID=461633 RepID=A0AAP0EPB4_9MAGN